MMRHDENPRKIVKESEIESSTMRCTEEREPKDVEHEMNEDEIWRKRVYVE